MRRCLLVLLVTTACGRLGFDEANRDETADAQPITRCSPSRPFGTPVPIAELDTASDDGTLRLSPDELTGYFWSNRTGDGDVYLARRRDLTAPFEVLPVTGVNTAANEIDPTLSSDGSFLLFRRSGPGDDIYIADRLADDSFTAARRCSGLSSDGSDVQPFLQPNGDEVYLSSNREGDGMGDLYRSMRVNGTFVVPARVAELAAPSDEGDPVLTADGLALYFRSDRAGGPGKHDIYVAERSSVNDPWNAPQLVENVNSAADDGPSWVSLDGCRMYISSDRAGSNDIYVATRQ